MTAGMILSGSHVKQIVIGVVAAEAGGRLHEAELVDDFFARISRVRPEEEVAPPPVPRRCDALEDLRMVISCET